MKRIRWACLLLCAVAAACDGGGPSEPDNADRSSSHKSFAEQVDKICADGRAKLEDLDPPGGLEESGPFLREILPVIREQQSDLRDLGEPPAKGRELYLEWFSAREGIVETTALMIAAAEDGDRDEFERLAATQADLDRVADKAAAAYGLKICGSSSSD